MVSGLGFHTSTSYGAVNDPTQLQQLRTVEFELIARNDNGILVYAEDRINTVRDMIKYNALLYKLLI